MIVSRMSRMTWRYQKMNGEYSCQFFLKNDLLSSCPFKKFHTVSMKRDAIIKNWLITKAKLLLLNLAQSLVSKENMAGKITTSR